MCIGGKHKSASLYRARPSNIFSGRRRVSRYQCHDEDCEQEKRRIY